MKARSLALLLAVVMIAAAFAGCSGGEGKDENKLVIYSPNSDDLLNATIPLFEEMYGVQVEIIQGGAGELLARIDAEKESPYADVIFGGGESLFTQYREVLYDYVSENDGQVMEQFRNTSGLCTNYVVEACAIIVNTDLIGDLEVNGYMDLLQPELKGKIAAADPSASSSALFQVENMLVSFGGFEAEGGWEYIEQLLVNIDGKVASGSSAVWKSVADGEMVVGLTFEEAAFNLVRDGAPVVIVYPEEGAFFSPSPAAIVNNAPHLDNAKLFIDFLVSQEGQAAIAAMGSSRPVRDDVDLHPSIPPTSEIFAIEVDETYLYAHIDEIKERYQDLFVAMYPG